MNCTRCRRELRWQSLKQGLDMCRQCRQLVKARAHRHHQTEIGQIIGQYLWRAITKETI